MSKADLTSILSALSSPTRWVIVAAAITALFLLMTKAAGGDFLGGYSDHGHHTHMTWTFLHVGFDVYRRPFLETYAMAPPFPHPVVTWEQYPNAYPLGMSVVFLPPALLGGFVPMASTTFFKIVIGYLCALMLAALWNFAALMQREKSPVWTVVAVGIWIFALRAALMGFYDGAWLLAAALSVRALDRGDHAKSVLWFVASALISYRAACFAPFGLVAFWGLVRGADPAWKKAAVTIAAAIAALLVMWTFYMLVHHSPHEKSGADSPLLPLKLRGWTLLLAGLGLGVALGRKTTWLVGASIAVSTLLCILHAGHSWHGFVCYPPVLAFALSERKPAWAPVAIGVWIALFWRFAFFFEPFNWLEEVFLFIERAGTITN